MKLCSVTIQITPFQLYFRKVPYVLEYNLQCVNTIFFFKFANYRTLHIVVRGLGWPSCMCCHFLLSKRDVLRLMLV